MMMLLVFLIIILLLGSAIWWPLLAGLFGAASVTNKAGALTHIAQLMKTYDIRPEEIGTALDTHVMVPADNRSKGDILRTLLAYLGGIFILAGISTYIGMFWDSMGSTMRILTTLGVGYILLIVLISALYERKYPRLILPLTLASAAMMTNGWFVLIHELYPQGDNWREAVLCVFAVMAIHQWAIFYKSRRTVLLFTGLFFSYGCLNAGLELLGLTTAYIAIALGSSLFIIATALEKTSHKTLTEPALLIAICWLNSGLFNRIDLFTATNWACLIVGGCVISTAYGIYKSGRYPRLVILGYFLGSVMAYSGLFDLLQNTSVELLFLAITATGLYASVVLQSRALLLTSVIAMLGFIVYFSEKYFANSLGWPATLVLLGIIFLGIGAIAIKLKRSI
ncbi:DUF2157 domain-containing protein [Amphritea sp. 2_MG-2023]|uniref:DUF2157 domain-containing protein n=1 Tax=Amphritea TaxID=515417 RepID=UPI001C064F8D|nr:MULTISPECIES: DUF2157 domain-containing protein [Amphritea]MBU2966874.1 DUF2157 domain-containing protein [Amphritea atlantica]MDO6420090.1 DUF2157 domain-containing protein [Amphritea sp. 2_MG-2023]